MTFGDGATTFYPLVSLDVTAHEVAHGFTEYNSGLIYSGQSGGINEAFSDMAGEAAEFYIYGTNDFKVGWDIFKSNRPLRDMADPAKYGSAAHLNDYYEGMDVHYSSGIFNKAFYHLATIDRWNTKLAFQVMANANLWYWKAGSTFKEAAEGVAQAAEDLGWNAEDVRHAFNLVGIRSGGRSTIIHEEKGVSVTSNGEERKFVVNVTDASFFGFDSISVVTEGLSGDADLYVALNSEPIITDGGMTCGNCAGTSYTSNSNERVDIISIPEGAFSIHITIYAYLAFTDIVVRVTGNTAEDFVYTRLPTGNGLLCGASSECASGLCENVRFQHMPLYPCNHCTALITPPCLRSGRLQENT